MSADKFNRAWSFIDGAKTAMDALDGEQGGKHERSEYWRGYRHALDHVGGYLDEIESEAIEGTV